jgi:cell division protein ZapA
VDKQKIIVTIAEQEFSLVSDEPEEHVHKTAGLVDEEINAVRTAVPSLSATSAATLSAVNLADRFIRAQETADSLRAQLKDYLEEVARAKNDLAETRRELNRLKKEK